MIEEQVNNIISNMEENDVTLLSVRPVSGDKVQLEFAQIIPTPSSGNAVLGMFNESDERFSGRSARRAWLSSEPQDAKRYLPEISDEIDQAIEKDEKVFIGLRDPETSNGKKLLLQVTEDHTPQSDWEEENLKQSAKSDGNGNYLLKDKKLIFSHVEVVADTANHTFIEHDETTTDPFGYAQNMEIEEDAEQSSIAEEEEAEAVEETVEA